jgi:hypothetical protein
MGVENIHFCCKLINLFLSVLPVGAHPPRAGGFGPSVGVEWDGRKAITHHLQYLILSAHQKLIAHPQLIPHPHRHRSPDGAHSCVIDIGAVWRRN